jgi:PAS domain S-box-containing protein
MATQRSEPGKKKTNRGRTDLQLGLGDGDGRTGDFANAEESGPSRLGDPPTNVTAAPRRDRKSMEISGWGPPYRPIDPSEPVYRLLVVEDNPAEVRLIAEYLAEDPLFRFEVQYARQLDEAREILDRFEMDVVVLDLTLPDSFGIATLDAILHSYPNVATVVLTGVEDSQLSSDAVRRGAQDYLVKSDLHPAVLVRAIRFAHERKVRENERAQSERELTLLSRLTREIAEAPTFEAALQQLIDDVCVATGWTAGEAWIPAPTADRLVRGPVSTTDDERIREFHAGGERIEMRSGEGLPGQVWATRATIWEPDLSESGNFGRARMAARLGLRTGVMIPVMAGDTVAAVLAFYHSQMRPEDKRLIHLLTTIAAQLGTVLNRRKTEDAFRQSEQWRKRLMDTANDGVCILDSTGKVRYINDRGCELLDRRLEDIVRHPLVHFFSQESVERIGRRLELYRSGIREITEVKVRSRREEEDRWLLMSTSPITNDDGSLEGSLVMLTDITPLKKSEQVERILADAGDAFSTSLDPHNAVSGLAELLVPDVADWCAVVLLDGAELRVEEVMAADPRHAGLLRECLDPYVIEAPREESRIWTVLRTADPISLERIADPILVEAAGDDDHLRLLRELGPRAAMLIPIPSRIRTSGVLILGISESDRRFGEREKALAIELARRAGLALENAYLYQETTHALRHRDEVLGVVAHDLRNPLGAISLYASMLEEGRGTEVSRKEWMASIRRSVDHMDRLIQDLLDITKLEAGGLRIEKEPTNVPALLLEVQEMFAVAARGRQIDLVCEAVTGGDPILQVDPTRLKQVLGNLVGNAIKFTPRGGNITVKAERTRAGFDFSVRDTGEGIAAEHLPHLFDRFWQSTQAKAGAGLGLAIAKGLVDVHDGRLSVESEVGVGTTFRFDIPFDGAAEIAVETPQPHPAARPAVRVTHVPRIVIADDHEIFLSSLEEVLRADGNYEVVARATTAEAAVEHVRLLGPDLVLMDLDLPVRGGVQAIREITAMGRPISIIALTGDPEEASLIPAIEAGARGYIMKSAPASTLQEAVDSVLRGGIGVGPVGRRLLVERHRQRRRAEDDNPIRALPEQERMILALVAAGYNSAEIGKRLFLSPKTIDTYRSKLMRSLGLRHRSELVRLAVQTGLLRKDDPL